MKVLVTGASGFVGREIVAELVSKGHEVLCLMGLKTKKVKDLPNLFQVDITDSLTFSDLEKSIKNIEAVIHSAGLAHQFGKVRDEEFWKVNVKGTENVARMALEIRAKHFILISSVSVYGNILKEKNPVDETADCNPQGVYGQSKFEAEKAAREICEKNKIPLTILRLATVIGEGDRGNTARLIRAIDRRRFFWIGKGENRKSLIYKRDAAEACLKVLAKKTKETEIFNVTAEPCKMKFIVEEIASALGKSVLKQSISVSLLKKMFRTNAKTFHLRKIEKLAETVEKWISEDVFSGEKIAEVYGFRAETTVKEAIRRQVSAFQAKKNRKNRK